MPISYCNADEGVGIVGGILVFFILAYIAWYQWVRYDIVGLVLILVLMGYSASEEPEKIWSGSTISTTASRLRRPLSTRTISVTRNTLVSTLSTNLSLPGAVRRVGIRVPDLEPRLTHLPTITPSGVLPAGTVVGAEMKSMTRIINADSRLSTQRLGTLILERLD
jgi:hypothetical protein